MGGGNEGNFPREHHISWAGSGVTVLGLDSRKDPAIGERISTKKSVVCQRKKLRTWSVGSKEREGGEKKSAVRR